MSGAARMSAALAAVAQVGREQTLEEAFPAVDAGIVPLGARVLVQIRTPMTVTKGGIILADESQETEKWNAQVAKVIALGPVAFCDRKTLEKWPEGAWCAPGQFVRVGKYGGDRWEVPRGQGLESALFVIFKDLDIIGHITADPRTIKAFF